jgi:SAM-dependent methyltransferase
MMTAVADRARQKAPAPGGASADDEPDYVLYRELADWWPLISPPAEYADDAAAVSALFAAAGTEVRSVLDLGSGGGHLALHLKPGRSMTLVDLSARMLAVSARLNPDCEHLQGDMYTLRLGRQFDAVLGHDAVDYVTEADDLRRVIATAFEHCRPGGIAVFAPDHTAEAFRPGTGGGGGNDGAGRLASFRERTSDPDPADDWILAEYEFTLREPDGTARVVPEAHRLGAFRRDTWLTLLTEAGFEAAAVKGRLPGGRRLARIMFTGRRPAERPADLTAGGQPVLGEGRLGRPGAKPGVDGADKRARVLPGTRERAAAREDNPGCW